MTACVLCACFGFGASVLFGDLLKINIEGEGRGALTGIINCVREVLC